MDCGCNDGQRPYFHNVSNLKKKSEHMNRQEVYQDLSNCLFQDDHRSHKISQSDPRQSQNASRCTSENFFRNAPQTRRGRQSRYFPPEEPGYRPGIFTKEKKRHPENFTKGEHGVFFKKSPEEAHAAAYKREPIEACGCLPGNIPKKARRRLPESLPREEHHSLHKKHYAPNKGFTKNEHDYTFECFEKEAPKFLHKKFSKNEQGYPYRNFQNQDLGYSYGEHGHSNEGHQKQGLECLQVGYQRKQWDCSHGYPYERYQNKEHDSSCGSYQKKGHGYPYGEYQREHEFSQAGYLKNKNVYLNNWNLKEERGCLHGVHQNKKYQYPNTGKYECLLGGFQNKPLGYSNKSFPREAHNFPKKPQGFPTSTYGSSHQHCPVFQQNVHESHTNSHYSYKRPIKTFSKNTRAHLHGGRRGHNAYLGRLQAQFNKSYEYYYDDKHKCMANFSGSSSDILSNGQFRTQNNMGKYQHRGFEDLPSKSSIYTNNEDSHDTFKCNHENDSDSFKPLHQVMRRQNGLRQRGNNYDDSFDANDEYRVSLTKIRRNLDDSKLFKKAFHKVSLADKPLCSSQPQSNIHRHEYGSSEYPNSFPVAYHNNYRSVPNSHLDQHPRAIVDYNNLHQPTSSISLVNCTNQTFGQQSSYPPLSSAKYPTSLPALPVVQTHCCNPQANEVFRQSHQAPSSRTSSNSRLPLQHFLRNLGNISLLSQNKTKNNVSYNLKLLTYTSNKSNNVNNNNVVHNRINFFSVKNIINNNFAKDVKSDKKFHCKNSNSKNYLINSSPNVARENNRPSQTSINNHSNNYIVSYTSHHTNNHNINHTNNNRCITHIDGFLNIKSSLPQTNPIQKYPDHYESHLNSSLQYCQHNSTQSYQDFQLSHQRPQLLCQQHFQQNHKQNLLQHSSYSEENFLNNRKQNRCRPKFHRNNHTDHLLMKNSKESSTQHLLKQHMRSVAPTNWSNSAFIGDGGSHKKKPHAVMSDIQPLCSNVRDGPSKQGIYQNCDETGPSFFPHAPMVPVCLVAPCCFTHHLTNEKSGRSWKKKMQGSHRESTTTLTSSSSSTLCDPGFVHPNYT
ncbi:hypothetical protein HELRODRAFT_182267 [Helobdella robusta]|uniref:Uncharacterized protein n=1 Tax=Helobdella robusta TaxID=6412 RepID=T1FI05_HELRO|nr:hypothetical protein HELRODRAFT_182267 [Helobdella robusta]ESN91111.1 hypothetical protein HELRODRAFT_182267 [Helobdella robusta]